MSLVEAVLAAQRERETIAEMGTPEQRRCKSPFCDRVLLRRNKSGYCYKCTRGGLAQRWADLESRTARKAKGRCVKCQKPIAPESVSRCKNCLVLQRAHQKTYRQKPGVEAKRQAAARQRAVSRKAAGLCAACGERAIDKTTRCERCTKAHRRVDKRSYRTCLIEADRARSRELLAQIPGRAA